MRYTYIKSALRTFYELQLFLIHLKFFYYIENYQV